MIIVPAEPPVVEWHMAVEAEDTRAAEAVMAAGTGTEPRNGSHKIIAN